MPTTPTPKTRMQLIARLGMIEDWTDSGTSICYDAAEMLRADAETIAALRAQVEGLRKHVADAIQIIDKHVGQFALGVGQDSARRAWPVRDEYLHNMHAALAPPQPVAKEK